MKSFVTKLLVAIFGLTLITAPLAADAAQWRVGVGINPGGVMIRGGYRNGWAPAPAWRGYYRPGPVAWYPAPAPVYYDGYYGWAPGGFYGYYWHGRWYAHRRWSGGVWIYF